VTRFLQAHSGTVVSPENRGWGNHRGYPEGAMGNMRHLDFSHILQNISLQQWMAVIV